LNLELTTFKKLSTLELRVEFRVDNFQKVVNSGTLELTTFKKLSNLELRFDNFQKVVKSGT